MAIGTFNNGVQLLVVREKINDVIDIIDGNSNSTSLVITGGSIDSTVIGSTSRANGFFSNVTVTTEVDTKDLNANTVTANNATFVNLTATSATINVTSGTINGVTIGGTSAGLITGTTITASTLFSGNGASVTSVDAETLGGNSAADLRSFATSEAVTAYTNATSYADTKAATTYSNATSYADSAAATAYSNATSFAANADNISSGTLTTARLDDSGATPGMYGNTIATPILTIDAKGRVTNVYTQLLSVATTLAGVLQGNNQANDDIFINNLTAVANVVATNVYATSGIFTNITLNGQNLDTYIDSRSVRIYDSSNTQVFP